MWGLKTLFFSSLEMDYEKMNESLHCHVSILPNFSVQKEQILHWKIETLGFLHYGNTETHG
jgi:hypothetical protein